MPVPYHTHDFVIPDGTFATPAQGAKADTALQEIQEGSNITIDVTDPLRPIISATGGGGGGGGVVDDVVAGTGIAVNDSNPAAPVVALSTTAIASLALADSATQPGDLATVATSGAYNDLSGKPSLGTAAAENTTAFATSTQGGKADTAVQPARSISAGTGLTGGGSLASDRTISLSSGSIASLALADSAVQPADLGDLAVLDTVAIADIAAAGTPSASNYLRGDGAWATPAGGGGGGGEVISIVDGAGIDVDSTDTANPIVSLDAAAIASLALADSATQPGDLATVATSGAYNDLSGKPTLGTAAAQNTTAFATAAQGSAADTAVQPARSVSAGTGLTGGGDLSANRTLALSSGTIASLALADTAVQPARSVSAGTGLTGGGDLSTNRTLSLDSGTTTSLGKADTAVQPARSVSAGTGLTGGGDLSTNRTIALDSASIASLAKADSALQSAAIGSTVQGYDADTAKTDVDQAWTGSQRATQVALTSGTTVTMLFGDGNDFTLTLGHNATLANPSDIASFVGQKGSIAGVQDGTGGRTLAVGSLWFPVGAASTPAIPTGANAKWRLDYHVVSSTRIDFTLAGVGV